MLGGQPSPKDKNGRDWPQDRWGRPMRPLWDYPLGVRAPGEAVAPGEPGSFSTADAINAYLKAEAVFANPMGIRRAASAAPAPANVSAIVASDRTGTDTQTPQRGVASRYPGAYDVAQEEDDLGGGGGGSFGDADAEIRIENYRFLKEELERLDPKNRKMFEIKRQDSVPSNETIGVLSSEIARIHKAIDTTVELIKSSGPFLNREDGTIFENRQGRLPPEPYGYYTEYTVEDTTLKNRGRLRIVMGACGEKYYSPDHYLSFMPIK